MRLRQVQNVNIIPNARAVRRRIIRPENLTVVLLAEGHFEHVGNEMRFDPVMLAKFFARPRSVEVAEGDKLQTVNLLVPPQNFLEHQLGFAVGIDWALGQVLGHWHAVRRPVSRARRAEHEFLHPALNRRIQQFQSVGHVVVKVFPRIGHGLGDQRVGREVHDRFRPRLFHGLQDVVVRLGPAQNESRPPIHRRAMPLAQIVIDRDRVARVQQFFRTDRTDIPGPAGDEYVHARDVILPALAPQRQKQVTLATRIGTTKYTK